MSKVLLTAALVLLLWASAAPAIVVEAESFVGSYNAGGDPIYVVDCSGASGGRAVEGFDTAGDWIEVILNVPEPIAASHPYLYIALMLPHELCLIAAPHSHPKS